MNKPSDFMLYVAFKLFASAAAADRFKFADNRVWPALKDKAIEFVLVKVTSPVLVPDRFPPVMLPVTPSAPPIDASCDTFNPVPVAVIDSAPGMVSPAFKTLAEAAPVKDAVITFAAKLPDASLSTIVEAVFVAVAAFAANSAE